MSAADPEIREPGFADLPGAYRLCIENAVEGDASIDPDRTPELLGHVFVGPYLRYAPEWCRVVADVRGVAGYLLAVPSTRAFALWSERRWWPALRRQHLPGDDLPSAADRDTIRLLSTPPFAPGDIVDEYPAHLHIDFAPRVRGRGLARALIDDLGHRLAAAGVPGVHLGVGVDNARAIAVYRRLGFAELRRDVDTVWMGRGLDLAAEP